MHPRNRAALWVIAFALPSAHAALTDAPEIVIGQVAGYTGPVSMTANEIGLGARVAIEAINSRGGLFGRKLRLLAADDQFKPDETVRLVQSMIGRICALLPPLGSANIALLLKQGVIDRTGLPVLGTIPTQESFVRPLHKNIFHYRATDRHQLEKIVAQLTTVGLNKIAVMAPDTLNGKEGAGIIEEALHQRGLKAVSQGMYELSLKANFEPQIKMMQESAPDAIIFLGPTNLIAELTTKMRARGVSASLFSASYADYKVITKIVGSKVAHGFAIAQVMPNLNNSVMPLVKSFRSDYEKYRNATYFGRSASTPAHFTLEGYIAVQLIAEAIRRTNDASPNGVRRGLEQLRDFDLGGFFVDFSPTKHIGSSWVDLSIIGARGQLIY